MRLQDFSSVTSLHRSQRIHVSRAWHRDSERWAILKALPQEQLHHQAIARLRYEYRVLCDLKAARAAHVPQVMGFLEEPGTLAVVLEDVEARSLRTYLQHGHLELAEALYIARQVAAALVDLHRARVIHKDINPNNIVYNRDTGVVQLIDFDLASLLPREVQSVDSLHMLEGTLPYVSPEQTGRLSRALDYRSDFFSLGATLYELLTDRLPFEGEELAEIVYAILAKAVPAWPDSVPAGLSALVDRLLHKDPEARYKSAGGLVADLDLCVAQWQKHGAIAPFPLGASDRSEHFDLPQRLYGRADAVETLLQAYRRLASEGGCGFVFVTGPSGMGKSALVGALHGAIVQHDGLFAGGKYEFLRRHQPFSAVSQALESLVRSIAGEPAAALDKWQLRLRAAVGNVGQALLELAPSLELLLGKQKPLPALGPQETENRLLNVLVNFLQALTARQPLVLFLDDLQWADQGTLKWLARMAHGQHPGAGLLVVGAYRDNEVQAQHPLQGLLQELQAGQVPLHRLQVQPMSREAVAQLVRDATQAPPAEAEALAGLVVGKTGGVPFFVHEFLRTLWARELLTFRQGTGSWGWDLAAVQAATVTENVAQLMSASLAALPPAAQAALSLAACMGNAFALAQLAAVSQQPLGAVLEALTQPLALGLIVPEGSDYRYAADDASAVRYRFAHDQIVQSAYDLMAPEAAQAQHAALGRYLMQQPSAEAHANAVVEQLNRALPRITDAAERVKLARLNWLAGRDARLAAAYDLAAGYLRAALGLLGDAWSTQHTLLESLHMELASALAMAGDSAAAEPHLAAAESHALTPLLRARVATLRAQLLAVNQNLEGAAQAGAHGLRVLGHSVQARPSPWAVLSTLWRFYWTQRGTDLEAWLERPPTASEEDRVAEALLGATAEVALVGINVGLYVQCLFLGATTVLRGGVFKPNFPAAIAHLNCTLNRYGAARRWTAFTHRMVELRPDPAEQARLNFPHDAYVGHLDTLPTALMARFASSVSLALEVGDTLLVAHSDTAHMFVQSMLSVDGCLQQLTQVPPLQVSARQINAHAHEGMRRMCLCLLGESPEPTLTAEYDDYARGLNRPDLPMQAVRGTYAFFALVAAWVHGDYPTACAAADRAVRDGVFGAVTDHIAMMFTFFASLAYLHAGKRPWWRWLTRAKLKRAAAAGPAIYGGMPVLVQALEAADHGRDLAAQQLFERANRLLAQSGYTAFIAAGLECAGRHAARVGLEGSATSWLQRAREAYEAWGAQRKGVLLQREFAAYLSAPVTAGTWRSSGKSSRVQSQQLDLPAVIEVSQALAGEMDLRRLVQKTLRAMEQNAGATRTALLFKTEETLQVVGDTQGEGSTLPHELIGYVVRTQQPLLVNDPAQLPPLRDAYLQSVQPKALICAPIMHQGRLRGVVYLENRMSAGAFDSERLSLVQLLASQAAVAMENARLYTGLEEVVAHRTEELRQAHARLIQLERQSTEIQMAGGFAHEMRNALGGTTLTLGAVYNPDVKDRDGTSVIEMSRHDTASIRALLGAGTPFAQLEPVLGRMEENQALLETAMAQIESGLDRALRITTQILNYAQVGSLIVGDEQVSLGPLVDQILGEFSDSLRKHAVTSQVRVPADLQLPMKQEHAFTILRNLVDNAIDALRARDSASQRQLEVVAEVQEEQVVLTVHDSGAGISQAAQRRMFEPFFSTKGAHGTGLGLGLCKKLSQAYGGDITFVSSSGEGTTFALRVPRRS